VIVVKGRSSVEMSGEQLARAKGDRRVVIDLGTGDGRFAYWYAKQDPDALVIGIDSIAENLEKISRRAARKPSRGGVANVLFVRAGIEALPPELWGIADEIHVVLPWAHLLQGLVLADPDLLGAVASLGRPGASLRLIINYEVWEGATPKDLADLPPLTRHHVEELAPRYREAGIGISTSRLMTSEEVDGLESTWARKLAHGRHPRFFLIDAGIGSR
jgi:16S rRNA (adenine(1408)-N(1))-methyltransferase